MRSSIDLNDSLNVITYEYKTSTGVFTLVMKASTVAYSDFQVRVSSPSFKSASISYNWL